MIQKNESDVQNIVVDPIDEQLGKRVYVIFDGPMAGIYQKWAISKTFIEGKKVRHKSYSTMEEAKAAFSAAYKEVTMAKNIQESSNMKTKKKVSVETILSLERMRKKERTFADFINKWKWLNNYSEEFAKECFYPVNNN